MRKRTEELAMLAFEVQPESGVERVAGLVPQNAHALGVRAALDFQHLLPFELHQPRVREVKRDRDAGTPSGENHSSDSQTWGLKRIPRELSSL